MLGVVHDGGGEGVETDKSVIVPFLCRKKQSTKFMGKSIQALIHVHSLIIRINPFICDNRERERQRERDRERDRQTKSETDRERQSEHYQSFSRNHRKLYQ